MEAIAERGERISKPKYDGESLPMSLPLELLVKDAETIAELCRHREGIERDQFALDALRIGVLERQAGGVTPPSRLLQFGCNRRICLRDRRRLIILPPLPLKMCMPARCE